MKVAWICGLPEIVRQRACDKILSPVPCAAWSWILGHLPPPKDVDMHIVCPVIGLYHSRVDFEYMGAHWHCFRQYRYERATLWLRFWLQVRGFIKSLAPDVIHGWGVETGCGRVATLLSRRAVVSVQGLLLLYWHLSRIKADGNHVGFRTQLTWFIEKLSYRKASKLLVESMASMRGLRQYYGLSGDLVPHPLRKEFLTIDLGNRNALKKVPPKFVFVGGFVGRKGAIDALKAFAEMSVPSCLVMIGDGEDKTRIRRQIKEHKIEHRVTIKSNLSAVEIAKEFSNAHFFVLPSYGDTGPTALKEALASGLYPICYANSGPQDLIKYYGCGRLVETSDIKGLTKAMNECICNIGNCIKESTAAATKVRTELSPENVWNKLIDVYSGQIE